MKTYTPLTLVHGQEVRGKGFQYAQKITVGTITGSALKYGDDPLESIDRAKKFGHPLEPWTNQSPAVMTADYPGKAEEHAAKLAATAASPELENGQLVEIEGCIYKVKLLGQQYSDPIAFVLPGPNPI